MHHSSDVSKFSPQQRLLRGSTGLFLLIGLFLGSGCMTTRGIIYLNPTRSGAYLAKEKKPTQSKKKVMVEKAVEEARKLLRTVPDGNRILGGFCSTPAISRTLAKIQDLAPLCRKKLKKHQNTSNIHQALFWSFLGATGVTGISMALGGFLAEDGATKGALVLGFGIPMMTFALVNTIGPFARIASRQRTLGGRIDNYMWTIRRRISVEVCNAPNRATASYRLAKIHQSIHTMCTSVKPDDGMFRIPQK